jgi:uncharacterized integral membrane protein (TIGR00698 family)
MTPPTAPPTRLATAYALLPGIILSAGLALLAMLLRQAPYLVRLSPLILALALGMAFRQAVGVPGFCRPGVTFSLRRVLRLAVMLLGLQISLHQVVGVGGLGLVIVVASLAGSYLFIVVVGTWLRIDHKLGQLIAAGTSICGASAVLAANTVAEGSDEDAAYAIAVVTVFGTFSMLVYPFLPQWLHLSEQAYGLWAGASIHEVAQVLGAAMQNGEVSVEVATVSKLSRVLLLAPLVAVLSLLATRKGTRAGERKARSLPVPPFVLGFVGLCLLNTLVPLSDDAKRWFLTATSFLLSVSLAAMGLEMDVNRLSGKGLRALLLGGAGWLFIAGLSYALIRGFGY